MFATSHSMTASLVQWSRRVSFIRSSTYLSSSRGCLHSSPRASSTSSKISSDSSETQGDQDAFFETLTKPTWSVNELLSTYPAPKLSPSSLTRLHKLSALQPPPEDSSEFKVLQEEMEGLIRLVEAVKLVDTTGVSSDGRIWPTDRGTSLDTSGEGRGDIPGEEMNILKHAAKAADGFYIADTPPSLRRKK